jgi:hypothetical protein
MTNLCHITPIPLLEQVLTDADKHHLVISNLIVSNTTYRQFYRKRRDHGDFIILDTPAFEEVEPDLDEHLEAVRLLQPNEIVIPDDMGSAEHTIELAKEFIWALADAQSASYHPQLMAVPHGDTYDEYIGCAHLLGLLDGVTTLGIQEEVEELYSRPRFTVAEHIKEITGKDIHLLGVTEHYQELMALQVQDVIRTCDSAKWVVWGLNGLVTDPMYPAPPYPGRKSVGGRMGYFDYDDVNEQQLETAKFNIELWREYLR